jgi:RNA polymerase sigma-70 factor (ECF subfamily)
VTSTDVVDDVFLEHRGALFGLAYRMLGSVCDAEDVVSDAYLRWQNARQGDDEVDNPKSYLFAIVARLSIDTLRSARRTDWAGDPAVRADAKDSLSLGLMRLLEQLTPVERAVFILREAFDYPHEETAELLELSPASARQHYRRARKRLAADDAPRFVASRSKQDELMQRLMAAIGTGEVQPLADLLATDAVLYADGGGKASAIVRPAHGNLRIARFFRGLARHAPADMRVDLVWANGDPAMLVSTPGEVLGVYAFEVDPDADEIRAVHAVRNPDKLRLLPAG